jgi:anti-sigma factor RsiW
MLCTEFEDRLTDYLDGALAAEVQRAFGEHALRCPLCHEILNEVRNTISECRASEAPAPSREFEARILLRTAPETSMTCEDFETHLTDYLDGFLPATLFHRWERHAALCERCTELPGQVVRSIGACYSYISIEQAVPAGLHERILQATLGTTQAQEVRPPLAARLVERLRGWLDVVVQPQFATVATMVLLAVFVGTHTISEDGSIGGMYRASVQLAADTYSKGANSPDLRRFANGIDTGIDTLVGAPARDGAAAVTANDNKSQPAAESQKDEQKK